MYPCAPNLGEFGELQFLRPNLPKKDGVLGQTQSENNLF